MRQPIKHGVEIDTLTPAEAKALLDTYAERDRPVRVRASAVINLDATGNGQDEVYACPMGYEFEVRRCHLELSSTMGNPVSGRVIFGAGKWVEFLRSGTRIEYAATAIALGTSSVPGIETWGAEQGPHIANGEVFEVKAVGISPNDNLLCAVEGILKRPSVDKK